MKPVTEALSLGGQTTRAQIRSPHTNLNENPMDIFIRNLSTAVTENDLKELFEPYGNVPNITMMKKHASVEPLGFAFVSMPTKSQAISAINALKGATLKGQAIEFNDLGPRFERRKSAERRNLGRGKTERRGSVKNTNPSLPRQ